MKKKVIYKVLGRNFFDCAEVYNQIEEIGDNKYLFEGETFEKIRESCFGYVLKGKKRTLTITRGEDVWENTNLTYDDLFYSPDIATGKTPNYLKNTKTGELYFYFTEIA